jgi:allophanate hydrolase
MYAGYHMSEPINLKNLLIAELRAGYRTGRFTPVQVAQAVLTRIDHAPERYVWITRLSRQQVLAYAQAIEPRPQEELPLYGIPFAIKDNIDLAGVPTTAACPEYAYVPQVSATVVQKLIDAGSIPVGKTNLDQFATGLVGTRSPYGACQNSFDTHYIAGGSSSGSAVAVATGLVSMALGTDTAGSGRVPAAFNNIVGLKPTRGRLSTRGVVPACRSLDCVSILALTAEDAARVLAVTEGFDADDPYARRLTPVTLRSSRSPDAAFAFGMPRSEQLEFFGDLEYARLFDTAVAYLEALGGQGRAIDFAPFLAAARLLYDGSWIAERYAALADFLALHPQALHPVTWQIIAGGAGRSAVQAFRDQYQLMALKRLTESMWSNVEVLVTPTTGTIYRLTEIDTQPVALNANLGYYTNGVNLLDLAAVAVPAGQRSDGLPFGVTLLGPASSEGMLLALAARLQRASDVPLGALGLPLPADPEHLFTAQDHEA